ncbi:MAG: LysR family transcriptional regulator [Myxococcota bacterium]
MGLAWDDLRVLLAAAREGSVSAAARSLGVEQSTASRRLARLERALGVVLFDRRPDGLRATAAAETILADAEGAEAAIARLEARASGLGQEVRGVVRVAATDALANLVLVPALPELLRAHPQLSVALITATGLSDLVRREADVALRNVRPEHPDLVSRKLAHVDLVPCASTAYLAERRARAPSDLDWVTLASPAPGVVLPEGAWVAQHAGRPPRLVSTSLQSQSAAVLAGLGAGVLSRYEVSQTPGLVELRFDVPAPEGFDIWMVTHAALRRVPRVRVVLDFLVALAERTLGAE